MKDNFRRKRASKNIKKSYIIFCEWESEKYYFSELKKDYKSIQIDCKLLQNRDFEWAAQEVKKFIKWKNFDRIFCVLDRNRLTQASYEKGKKNLEGIRNAFLIYSNKSFEVWLLMHFNKFNKSVNSEDEYWKFLKKYNPSFKKPYEWSYTFLKDKLEKAVENAEKVNEEQLLAHRNNKFLAEPYTDIPIIIRKIREDFWSIN